MFASSYGNLIVETVTYGILVMRFTRPDVRRFLDDGAETETSPLFKEIQDAVLSDLPRSWTLVINLGLINPINAAFYRCLLDIRKCVQARQSQLVLCGLSPMHQEVFELFRGPEVFTIVSTEDTIRRDTRWAQSEQKSLQAHIVLRTTPDAVVSSSSSVMLTGSAIFDPVAGPAIDGAGVPEGWLL